MINIQWTKFERKSIVTFISEELPFKCYLSAIWVLFSILTGCSSVVLGTSSWPAPCSPFHPVWFMCQSQCAAYAPSARYASVQRSLPFVYTRLTDVIWNGDQVGLKARRLGRVTVKGTFWCYRWGKIVQKNKYVAITCHREFQSADHRTFLFVCSFFVNSVS